MKPGLFRQTRKSDSLFEMGPVDFKVVIPARYASTRLPGKALRLMAGRPMLQHVCERAGESSAQQVVVATDDRRIAETASGYGVTVCMTSSRHTSGTERLAEVVEQLGHPFCRP